MNQRTLELGAYASARAANFRAQGRYQEREWSQELQFEKSGHGEAAR
jgi:hypothetical protein